jgi:predicted lipoprotein
MNSTIKCTIWIVIFGLIGYNSIYFKKLSTLKAMEKKFDAASYAKDLLDNKLPPVINKAISLDDLLAQIKTSADAAFKNYGHSLTIGSAKFFMVKGTAELIAINESDITVKTIQGNELKISTEYIFGNDIRDAYGLIRLNDFSNTIDLSNISSEINKIIRTKVIPPFKAVAKAGDTIEFIGAIELNNVHLNVKDIELSPVSLKIIQ